MSGGGKNPKSMILKQPTDVRSNTLFFGGRVGYTLLVTDYSDKDTVILTMIGEEDFFSD